MNWERATIEMIKHLPVQEKERRQIHAIATGCQVHYSSYASRDHENYFLDCSIAGKYQCWATYNNRIG
jgi:hypothetical protein